MPSSTATRYSSPLSQSTTTTQTKTPFQQPPAQKKRIMSITQTYYLAHKARAKLSNEAARSDHDLRLLVGHANLLDSLMLELADAEREQESWFNQSVRGATHHEEEKAEKKEQHIRWADSTIVEDPEEDWQADDASVSSDDSSDSDEYDSEDDDTEMADIVSLRRLPSQQAASAKALLSVEEDEFDDDDMEEDDLEEDYAQLELVRTTSHSNSPPELIEHDLHDSDSSDDESMPPSPPNTILTFSEKEAKQQQQSPTTAKFYSEASIFRKNSPTSIVSAISVY